MRYSLESEVKKLLDRFSLVGHLSRKKFLALYVLALINSRNVQFSRRLQTFLILKLKMNLMKIGFKTFSERQP